MGAAIACLALLVLFRASCSREGAEPPPARDISGPASGAAEKVAPLVAQPSVTSAPKAVVVDEPSVESVATVAEGRVVYRGVVRDLITDEPIEGARVEISETTTDETDPPIATATTGADGRYEMDASYTSGSRGIHVRCSGYLRYFTGFWAAPAEVISLTPGLVVTGSVLGPDGQPVESGVVLVKGDSLYRSLPLEGGEFEVTTGTRKLYFQVHAPPLATGFASINVDADGDNHVVVHLPRGEQLSGRVVDTEGKPIPGVTLRARQRPPSRDFLHVYHGDPNRAITDEDGEFVMDGLTKKVLELYALHPEYKYHQGFDVSKASGFPEIELERGQWLTGRLVSEDGTPIPPQVTRQETGREHWEFAITDDGKFRTHTFGRRVATGTLWVDQHLPVQLTWEPGTGECDMGEVVAKRGHSVQATVTAGGQPVAGVRISGFQGEGFERLQHHAVTDETGEVVLSGFEAGSVQLHAQNEQYVTQILRVLLDAALDEEPPSVTIELHETASVTGRIVDARGNPIFAAYIHVANAGSATSTPDGWFVFRRFPPAARKVLKARYWNSRASIEVPVLEPGAEHDLGDIVLETDR